MRSLVQPPHCAATDRRVIEIGDQERAVARDYLRVTEREMRSSWFGKRRRQFRIQRRDQFPGVGRRQSAAANVDGSHV